MNEILAQATQAALKHYGDTASREFLQRLRAGSFASTRCDACALTAFPPRPFCPRCLAGEVRWVELPHRGTLYAFTQQDRALRFSAPDVIGLVELEGVGHVLSRIDAPFASLRIGVALELDFVDIGAGVTLHQFRPAAAPAAGEGGGAPAYPVTSAP
ncbi:MAG TPA: OB-fold domain-containing protein [Myxococcota bacterium]|jgi:hypothetical protein|nr:OB-fold domain-containing protein [Myxococcota bacterium]